MKTCTYCAHAKQDDFTDEMNSYSPETIFRCTKRNKYTCQLTPTCDQFEKRMPSCAEEANLFYEIFKTGSKDVSKYTGVTAEEKKALLNRR